MSSRVAGTAAVHLITRAPARSAVIAATIAVPSAIAAAASVASWSRNAGLPLGAVGVTVAILAVAQASPEPTSVASARGWRAAGAGARAAGQPGQITLCLIGWTAALGAVVAGAVLGGLLAHAKPDWMPAWVLAVALIFAVPGSVALVHQRERLIRPSPLPRRPRVSFAVMVAAGAGALAAAIAGSVRTDFQLLLVVPVATVLTVIAVTSVLERVRAAAILFAGRLARWRGIVTLASRHRTRVFVQAVLVTALVVAAAATVLGASVASRAVRVRKVVAELGHVPVVPANVMALTLPSQAANPIRAGADSSGLGSSSGFSPTTATEVARRFPDSTVVPLLHVVNPSTEPVIICLFQAVCDLPVVIADPRLGALYQTTAPATQVSLAVLGSSEPVPAKLVVPTLSASVRARLSGHPLPVASWQNVNYLQVDRAAMAGSHYTTAIRTIFVTRPGPYSASERQALRTLARDPAITGQQLTTAVTSDQRSGGFGVSSFVRTAPWAPTAASTRWSIVGLAAMLALLVVLGTGTVDALDRRLHNRRLELLGATPGQLRESAALYTGMELGVAALLATLSVAGLVAFGVHQYSAHSAGLPVSFVLPLPQLAILVLGMPAIGAAIAAAVARTSLP